MALRSIDDSYLRDFFGIGTDETGELELEEIRGKLERLQFQNGEDICTIDGPPDGMFFLESGSAVVLGREGEQLNLLRKGQYFGEYGVLSGERRLSTVRSLGRTVVYRLGNEDMMEILHRHPGIYGELMKRVYGQVSGKHSQLMTLSRMQRGILQAPENRKPLSPLRMLVQYGVLAVLFLLSALLIPMDSLAPIFLLPLILMLVHVLLTRRTLESLIVAGMLAAILVYRGGLAGSYADAVMDTMATTDNAFTVLVMALMGGVISLMEAGGAVTAFRKLADRRVKSRRGARLMLLAIMAVTAIDDCLNMTCAATALRTVDDEQRIPREETGLMLSLLPTTLSSFIPLSLWGIFVIGSMNPAAGGGGVALFCRSLPFNFFSIITVAAMVLCCFGKLPLSGRLRKAEERVKNGGELWPEGSERYLIRDDTEVWGKMRDLLLPVAVLAISSLLVRSLRSGSFVVDSASGLVLTLIFMFFLYCAQGVMSPDQFFEHLVTGIQSMVLPIILYLLTMCLSALLEETAMGFYFDQAVLTLELVAPLLPAVLFFVATLLTMALGSSWAMYVIGFPAALRMASVMGLSVPLCAGAICAAGIAGEKLCIFTSDSLSVGNAIGCDPDAILHVRLPYSILFFLISLIAYVAAGFLF